jgi:hypothetical protein
MSTRPWGEGDLTGGPLDEVLQLVRRAVPDLLVERLVVSRPGDDDNVYFLGRALGGDQVQIDTASRGQPPFLLEAAVRAETSDARQAADMVVRVLRSGHFRPGDDAA